MTTPVLALIIPLGGGGEGGGVPSHPIVIPPGQPPVGVWPQPPPGIWPTPPPPVGIWPTPPRPVDPGYGRPGWGPVDPGYGVGSGLHPSHFPIYGGGYPSQGPIYGGGYPSHPIAGGGVPTHPIYWPEPTPPEGAGGEPKPPGAENLPPIVVWVPGIGYITATPGVPPKPVPEPTPPTVQPT